MSTDDGDRFYCPKCEYLLTLCQCAKRKAMQIDMSEILSDFATSAPHSNGSYDAKVNELMRHFARNGVPLERVMKHINRAESTLKKKARLLGLVFPDYCPRSLRKTIIKEGE